MKLLTFAAFACAAFAQTPARLTFDVADIQPHIETDQQPFANFQAGGRVDIRNMPLKQLILIAFNVGQGVADKLLSGVPDWANDVRYDIVAKADPKTSTNALRDMLVTLLEDRFKMKIHREDRPLNVFVLGVAKGGQKMQAPAAAGKFNCNSGAAKEGMLRLDCTNVTMNDLAKSLSTFAPRYFDIPVVNLTELNGAFDLSLEWTPVGGAAPGPATSGPNVPQHSGGDSADIAGKTIFDAVQQLGLKLDKRKLPYPVIVIDSIEKSPTEN